MVVFQNGASDRTAYRKFKIRSSRNDDTASMYEVIFRRLKHQEWPFPDLIILDGAAPQLSAVIHMLESARIPVIGRNKSGDHTRNADVNLVIPVRNLDGSYEYQSRLYKNDSHLAKLIARIDEESHRFAITYHRQLRSKQLLGR